MRDATMWTTALLTFVFFLLQLGTGLLILAIAPVRLIEACRLTKVQFAVMGFMIGASATGVLLGLLSLVISGIWLQLGTIVVLACIGLGLTWPVWRPRGADWQQVAFWCLLSLPIALITWWWTFGAFSQFPYGDIGADIHWMKTAQEYADSGVINPYATQSYVDLRSALAGALSGTLGLDLLSFSWIYRYFSILVFLLAFYAFTEGVYSDPSRKWIAFVFAAAGNTAALMTNGSLAVAGSIAFLGVLLRNKAEDSRELRPGSILLLAASIGATLLIAFLLNNNALVLVLLAVGLIVMRVFCGDKSAAILLVGSAWPATLLLAHRGSYLFVPTATACWLLYLVISQAITRWPARSLSILRILSFALPALLGTFLACIAAMRFGYLQSANANNAFSAVTTFMLGRKIESGEELFLGAGPQIAAIELGRAMGPLFSVCVTLTVAWWWLSRPQRSSDVSIDQGQVIRTTTLAWSWIAGCGLSMVVFSGFPFLYRITAIIVALFTITFTETFCQLLIDPVPASRPRRAVVAVTVVLLAAVLVGTLYAFAWRSGLPFAAYQTFLRPSEIAGIVLLAALLPLVFTASRSIYLFGLVAILGLAVTIDRAGLADITKSYSYGTPPDHAKSVSHYNASDLEAARWLHENMRKGIALSDPYTLGIVQAISGIPAAYVFSNLDTVNESSARQAKAVLSAIARSGDADRRLADACRAIAPILQEINQETYFQMRRADALGGILKPIRSTVQQTQAPPPTAAPDTPATEEEDRIMIQNKLVDRDGPWHLVAIINPRTIEWINQPAGQRLNYFAPATALDAGFVKTFNTEALPLVYANRQTAIVRIPCSG